MVMLWLEGGQGEVRGACAPPPPTPQMAPPGPPPPPAPRIAPLGPPPNRPSRSPPPQPLLYPPPHSPSLNPPPPPPRGLRPTVSWGGSWRPEPRGRPPRGAPQPLCNCSELAPRAPSPSSKPLGGGGDCVLGQTPPPWTPTRTPPVCNEANRAWGPAAPGSFLRPLWTGAQHHLEERPLDQARARAPYHPILGLFA